MDRFFNSLLYQFHFVGAGRGGPYGERKARSVCDCHDLGALAFLSFSDRKPTCKSPIDEAFGDVYLAAVSQKF
jgi:hypothetical protein